MRGRTGTRWERAAVVLVTGFALATACSVDSGRVLHPRASAGSTADNIGNSAGAAVGGAGTLPTISAGTSSTAGLSARGGDATAAGDGDGVGAGGDGTAAGAGGGDGPAPDLDSVCGNPSACVACTACHDGSVCPDEVSACDANEDCRALNGCLSACTDDTCNEHCSALYADGATPLTRALDCLACACADVCPRPDLDCR